MSCPLFLPPAAFTRAVSDADHRQQSLNARSHTLIAKFEGEMRAKEEARIKAEEEEAARVQAEEEEKARLEKEEEERKAQEEAAAAAEEARLKEKAEEDAKKAEEEAAAALEAQKVEINVLVVGSGGTCLVPVGQCRCPV